jgi:hypothetical protein
MLGMLGRPAISLLFGLAAMAAFAGGELRVLAQRQPYPILQEILVKQNCAILLAPADAEPGKTRAKFERDSTICHLEAVNNSQHTEEAIDGNELRRSRVDVMEQEYVLQNIAGNPVIFVVEQNVPKGWQVDSDPQPGELIPAAVGDSKQDKVAVFRVHAAPGEIVRLHVGERHTTPLKTKVLKSVPVPASGGL